MMVSFRRARLRFTLAALLPSAIGCSEDPQPATSASDTGTSTADEIGEGDTVAAESATTSDTTDATTSDTSSDTTSESTSDTSTDTTGESTSDTSTDTTSDATTGDGDCAGPCGTIGCGDCPDVVAIDLPGNYSMGATEVRNGDYAAFLGVAFMAPFLADWLPAECDWKTDFTPDAWPADPNADLPVTGVDWCDAWAYCEWSGQHLCGKIGGGPAQLGDVQNPATNQWYKACSGGGIKNYPYALDYVAAACNGVDAGFGQVLAVGSLMTCVGGYAGLYDLSGNAWEWENACDTDPMIAVEDRECRIRGGSYFSSAMSLRCAANTLRVRSYRNDNLGIRCCDMP